MGDVPGTEVAESVEGRARPQPESHRENERVSGPAGGAQSRAAQVGRTGRTGAQGGAATPGLGGGRAGPLTSASVSGPVGEVRVRCVSACALELNRPFLGSQALPGAVLGLG